MTLISDYFELRDKVFEYFGYVEDWKRIPLEDSTQHYWYCDGKMIAFSEKPFTLEMLKEGKEFYTNSVYKQRFLPKWVYRGEEFTMTCADMHEDDNKVLRVFDNSKEQKDLPQSYIDAIKSWH